MCWYLSSCAGSTDQRKEPISPFLIISSRLGGAKNSAAEISLSWPIFSSRVIFLRSSSTRRRRLGFWKGEFAEPLCAMRETGTQSVIAVMATAKNDSLKLETNMRAPCEAGGFYSELVLERVIFRTASEI